jgi:Glycosyltransferase
MKIGIVGPSPVPFTIGGVENLLRGLTDYINENTAHNAELIKLPSKENSFWDLIDSYYKFSKLDLSHFDMVISSKYPAWMVKHDNHVCYMQHRLRGLYDTYHFAGLEMETARNNKKVNEILDAIDAKSISLDEFFNLIYQLKDITIPDEYYMFPGPFIRKILHYLDNEGLKHVKNFYCISETVQRRTEYFPQGVKPTVIYHPPFLSSYKTNNYDYVFTVSRLDGPKRVNLLVEAMKYVKSNVKLKIAGIGPQEETLKKIAQGDDRIEFLGFINNDELLNYYANALVIPFVPYDEDYGLITIEAFKSAKPVITCTDSGGSNEFVTNGTTGFSVPPDPRAIAEKIDYLVANSNEAVRMGNQGKKMVQDITWNNVVNQLTGSATQPMLINEKSMNRPRMIITTTFPIYPPRGGGQSRIYNLYKQVAKHYNVEIFSFTNNDEPEFDGEIAPGLKEIRFPKTSVHQEKEWQIEQKVGIPIADVAMPLLSKFTPEYGQRLQTAVEKADVVVISHPYLYHELASKKREYTLIYEAQDVEYDLKCKVLPAQAKDLLDEVMRAEEKCCQDSDLIMTCSQEDAERLAELYNVPKDKFITVPNGVDTTAVPFIPWAERQRKKRALGLEEEILVLFVGSWHPPNLEACEEIFRIAKQLPNVKFLLMGSQCIAFKNRQLPDNVGLLGVVDDEEKNFIFSIVDLAINPMKSGSGTNLKMFDYLAAGIPVISTEFGARGIGSVGGEHLIICTVDEMPEIIYEFINNDDRTLRMVKAGHKLVSDKFDWKSIASVLFVKLNQVQGKVASFKLNE